MLKFVSLAAKQGRYEIARQTIKKILPDVDAWDIAFNSGDNHYLNGPLNGARRDLENFSTTKMTVLYKHIKHNVMPHKAIDRCHDLMTKFELENDDRMAAMGGKASDQDKVLYSRIYSRQAEINRKRIEDQRLHLENKPWEYSDIMEQTQKKYEMSLEKLRSLSEGYQMAQAGFRVEDYIVIYRVTHKIALHCSTRFENPI